MASDIGLVLRSEHRDLLILADRCGRVSRGFQDPCADLRRRLHAHLAGVDADVYPVLPGAPAPALLHVLDLVGDALADEASSGADLAEVARCLVAAEEQMVLPLLGEQVPIAERRRMGRVFRIRRDAVLSREPGRPHRQRSQSELYELARRAGVEHRSRMTQAQLQAAVSEAQRRTGDEVQAAG